MLTEIYCSFYNNRLYNVEVSFVKLCIHFFGGPCICHREINFRIVNISHNYIRMLINCVPENAFTCIKLHCTFTNSCLQKKNNILTQKLFNEMSEARNLSANHVITNKNVFKGHYIHEAIMQITCPIRSPRT